jgi:hypothetical protein
MDAQDLQPCVTRDRGIMIVIAAPSRKSLGEAMERYFRDLHPSGYMVEVEEEPFEKGGTWKVFLRKFKCR